MIHYSLHYRLLVPTLALQQRFAKHADLVRDNRKRFKVAFGLIGLGFLLALLGGKLQTASLLHWVLLDTGGVSVVVGFLLASL
jgi:hypothetical protein